MRATPWPSTPARRSRPNPPHHLNAGLEPPTEISAVCSSINMIAKCRDAREDRLHSLSLPDWAGAIAAWGLGRCAYYRLLRLCS